jgi:hypothetical protein
MEINTMLQNNKEFDYFDADKDFQELLENIGDNNNDDFFDDRFTRALKPVRMQGEFMELAF